MPTRPLLFYFYFLKFKKKNLLILIPIHTIITTVYRFNYKKEKFEIPTHPHLKGKKKTSHSYLNPYNRFNYKINNKKEKRKPICISFFFYSNVKNRTIRGILLFGF